MTNYIQRNNGGENVSQLTYAKILSKNDSDIFKILQIHRLPDISRFLSISDNYFNYVTNTENVYFYKVYENEKIIGTIHLEKYDHLLYMDILIFPEFQRRGFATKVMERLCEEAGNLNLCAVDLYGSNEGKPLYEKLGFKIPYHTYMKKKITR